MTREIYYYLARKSCGCAVGVIVDIPELRESVAQHIAGFIRAGYTVDRVALEGVTTARWKCPHIGTMGHSRDEEHLQ